MKRSVLFFVLPAIAAASAANASVTITQGNSAPTYATTLTFDEVGGPVGVNVPGNSWASIGISQLISGDVVANFVGDNSGISGTSDNSFYGPFGVFMTFDEDLTAASLQFWDTSGPGGPFGGGAAVVALNDGVEVGFLFVTPALGTSVGSWFDIVATDGMVFNEIRALGFGFSPQSVVDNVSFVPAPGSLALLGLGGAAALRRRRR
jgi:hypothetical protein